MKAKKIDINSILFYFFFVNTIFSLYISGFAFWLFILFPFLDMAFLNKELKYVNKRLFLLLVYFFIISAITLSPVFVLKVVFSYISVRYVLYTIKYGVFYFHYFIVLNVVVAIVQYVCFSYLGIKLLDPTLIAQGLYGEYALTTGDTFAPGFILEYRVSGLSREPAFFSSLLLVGYIVLLKQKELYARRLFYFFSSFYIVGVVLSFSKITLAISLVLPILYLARNVTERINPAMITIIFLFVVTGMVTVLYSFTNLHMYPTDVYQGGSVYHRTIGYFVLKDMTLSDLMFGEQSVHELAGYLPYIKNSEWWGFDRLIFDNSGLAQFIIEYGVVGAAFPLLLLYFSKVSGLDWIIFLIVTINVNPLTSTSFVILALVSVFINKRCKFENS